MFTSMTDGRLNKWTLLAFYIEYPKAALYTQTAQTIMYRQAWPQNQTTKYYSLTDDMENFC